ncbi:preprotein translocase subunit SecE [Nocardia sp. CDC159]|uniref:Protein translocase subunit SecE n=1 Tax=Nocardia pulmonis TaxID=2951408 RepID=A0A9X2E642_9NOCA|nr:MULTISPECIES: preprotein translocase subunit SecE [Nocardia]MCM6775017.1 preprotein translocase subunit SecE [Nocardia pulmonis]MCM6789487.1 preprotein translocase subunit SecE [Nocardia sp. CDC159]
MSDERDNRHGAHATDDDGTAVARPSGKRSARRARTSSADTGSIATIDRNGSARTDAASRKTKPVDKKNAGGGAGNPLKRLVKFLREVIAELRKVIWPNRKQMVTYTSVVLVFVVFMVAFISGLDLAFIKGVNWLFG